MQKMFRMVGLLLVCSILGACAAQSACIEQQHEAAAEAQAKAKAARTAKSTTSTTTTTTSAAH